MRMYIPQHIALDCKPRLIPRCRSNRLYDMYYGPIRVGLSNTISGVLLDIGITHVVSDATQNIIIYNIDDEMLSKVKDRIRVSELKLIQGEGRGELGIYPTVKDVYYTRDGSHELLCSLLSEYYVDIRVIVLL